MSTKPAMETPIQEVMTPDPICVFMGTTVRELAAILVENDFSGVPVVDAQERVIGVVSKTDLLDRAVEGGNAGEESFFTTLADGLELEVDIDADSMGTVEEFMSPEPITAVPDEPLKQVARRMADERIHRVVVVDGDRRVVGIVTTLDLLRALSQ